MYTVSIPSILRQAASKQMRRMPALRAHRRTASETGGVAFRTRWTLLAGWTIVLLIFALCAAETWRQPEVCRQIVDSARSRFEAHENVLAPIRKSLNQMALLLRDYIADDSEKRPQRFWKL